MEMYSIIALIFFGVCPYENEDDEWVERYRQVQEVEGQIILSGLDRDKLSQLKIGLGLIELKIVLILAWFGVTTAGQV